jgi:hypothetical protein
MCIQTRPAGGCTLSSNYINEYKTTDKMFNILEHVLIILSIGVEYWLLLYIQARSYYRWRWKHKIYRRDIFPLLLRLFLFYILATLIFFKMHATFAQNFQFDSYSDENIKAEWYLSRLLRLCLFYIFGCM